jgi:ATP-dependent DNA helicase RecQ
MEYLLRQLDDPHAGPCGRCDNCTSATVSAEPNSRRWSAEVSDSVEAAARERLRRPGVELAVRKQWPAGMAELGIPVSGRIPANHAAEPGRALGRLTDIGWGTRLRALLAPDVPDGDVDEDIVDACVRVLAAWEWSARPVGVVTVGSRQRPRLVGSLGARIAAIGRLRLLGSLSSDTNSVRGSTANSAQRLKSLWNTLTVPDDLAATVSTVEGAVLLVDDRVDTGWTMTVGARLLREAGAPAVLPFALAVTA